MPHSTRLLLLAMLLCCIETASSAQSLPERHNKLWERGEYARAIQLLEGEAGSRLNSLPEPYRIRYADLLATVGRVDDAINVMVPTVVRYASPAYTLRLAELYRYRGRPDDYQAVLTLATQQVKVLSRYRMHPDERVAAARIRRLKGEDAKLILADLNAISAQIPNHVPSYLEAGDLAFEKRTFDIAARNYNRVLELDDENQQALAGLAESYRASSDPRWRATLQRLLDLNPNHPRAHTLHAEALLDLGKTVPALDVLANVLSINPNHLKALALKSAAHFLEDRLEDAEAVRQQALSFNPHYSGVFRIPGRIASRHYRFEAGRGLQTKALRLNPDDIEARTLLAFDLLRLGYDDEAQIELKYVFEVDPYSVRAYNLLEVADAISQFETVESSLFRIQAPEQEARLLTTETLDLLNEAAALYQEKYRVILQTPVTLQMFDDHDEFIVRSVGLPGHTGHLGICFGRLITMDSPRARPPGATNWQQVLWHEFVHVITLQKTRNRLPRWLSEGISVYEETTKDATWGHRLDPAFRDIVDGDSYPGMADLERYFVEPESANHLMFGYYASGAFVAFYVDSYGDNALVDSLELIAEGTRTPSALETAAGVPLSEIDRRFKQAMRVLCKPLWNLPEDVGQIVAETDGPFDATAPFVEALKAGQQAAGEGDLIAAEEAFLGAHNLFPDYTAANAPLRQIVQLYEIHGPSEKYAEALERVVAWDNKPLDTCMKLARIRAEGGEWSEAIELTDRAFAVNPFDISMLTDRSHYFRVAGRLEEAEEVIRNLIHLDTPRQVDHRLTLVQILAERGNTLEAKREVVQLLEQMPHFWDAQKLLLEIVEQEDAE